jgi:hypothetical protein
VKTYKRLLAVNAGFDDAIRALASLRKHRAFRPREIDRFCNLSREIRASTCSYLIGVIEHNETREAGRRFGKRRERELREEAESG